MLTVPDLGSQKKHRAIAVLTSGGDAPGMNAAIRAVVRYGIAQGIQIYGVLKGYSGLLEGQIHPLTASSVANIIQRGGTILKTDRCEAFYKKNVRREAANILRRKGIDGLIVIGGDGSFTGAHLLEKENGFPTLGIPGTIDNDIAGTDDTIGFDTAVNTAIDAIDRIRDTASSHDRIFLVEVMGRNSGYIGVEVGIGGGAETIIVPEAGGTIKEVTATIERGNKRGKSSSIIVVAEGNKPGLSTRLADQLSRRGYSTKVCILGHTQRGGSPTAHDRVLASVLGASAMVHMLAGHSNAMVGVREDQVALVPFKQVIGHKKGFPKPMMKLAQILAI
ncbi:MAG TPA: 6-phosphofructokinase [Bdellovibrionota bacterium]|nr:6-phosphofructokinase [Bdellovibrionota bacterium]